VETTQLDDEGLRAAAAAAARLAGDATPELPDPAPGRPHDGYDPTAGSLSGLAEAVAGVPDARLTTAAGKIAIASARGARAYEQRSFAGARLAVGRGTIAAGATGLAGLDLGALAAELATFAGTGDPVDVAPGEYQAVLSPWAVASVLRRLSQRLDELAARRGARVVAPCINLSDSPRFPGTLPRSYDAEGTPKQPVPLIQDGVAHRQISHATGHAPSAGRTPVPEHLVLVGGGAADVAELAAGIERGLLLTDVGFAAAARVIEDGELGPPANDLRIAFDPFEILASTDALTARQRLVPTEDWRSIRVIGATVAPALRARAGIRVTG
jgi:predicted Zn-dependent protease